MNKTIRRTACAVGIGILLAWPAVGAQAAPAAATLPPAEVQSNGTYDVSIVNPRVNGAAIERLALQANVQGGPRVRQVRFTVFKDDSDVYYRADNAAPFCLFGDANRVCNSGQAGERWGRGQPFISVGDYTVEVAVFSNLDDEADWRGTVTFRMAGGRPVADQPAYGTGSGNGPLAEINDAFYSEQGMRAIRVQVRLFTRDSQPMKPSDVQHVWFRVQRTSDYETVFSNIEFTAPYCIFGEETDGRTCQTLSVGDDWPQSNHFIEDADGLRTGGKEADPDIPILPIEPGEYELSIQIRTNQGSWDSNGLFVLLP